MPNTETATKALVWNYAKFKDVIKAHKVNPYNDILVLWSRILTGVLVLAWQLG